MCNFVILAIVHYLFSFLSCASFYLASWTCPRSSSSLSFQLNISMIVNMNLLYHKRITGTYRSMCFLLTADFFVFLSFFLTHPKTPTYRLCYQTRVSNVLCASCNLISVCSLPTVHPAKFHRSPSFGTIP